MKNKKILAIILLVITLITLLVPMFSFSAFADDFSAPQFRIFNAELDFSMFSDYDDLVFDAVFSVINNDTVITSTEGLYINIYESTVQLWYDVTELEIIHNEKFLNLAYRLVYIQSLGDSSQAGYSKLVEFVESNSIVVNDLSPFIPFLNDYADKFYDIGYGVGRSDAERDYNIGFEDGVNEVFGKNLILGILSTPAIFLDGLTLFEYNSLTFSIWDLFMAAVGISLFVWFLKMFAGG